MPKNPSIAYEVLAFMHEAHQTIAPLPRDVCTKWVAELTSAVVALLAYPMHVRQQIANATLHHVHNSSYIVSEKEVEDAIAFFLAKSFQALEELQARIAMEQPAIDAARACRLRCDEATITCEIYYDDMAGMEHVSYDGNQASDVI